MPESTTPMSRPPGWNLESSYAALPPDFYQQVDPTPVREPRPVIVNHDLANSLGLDLTGLDDETLGQLFSGNQLPAGPRPLAQAYAGHQFGYFTMLGDGRAHVVGEQVTPDGRRYDVQFKGSGRTSYSRSGDGRAALAPMLREYLISEAMHALGIPTTRSLAVVTTGEAVRRESELPGAILTRVAASHLRVGTFQFAVAVRQPGAGLKELADYAIRRHDPELEDHPNPYLGLLKAVIERQAKLVAAWMHVGFIHGVMNTDNMTISGETIDYGPCAFMDRFAINTVFSSIDHSGRYAYGNQASIAHWNLTRFAESLLPLLDDDQQKAVKLAEQALETFGEAFHAAWLGGMRNKLGLFGEEEQDATLVQELLEWMQSVEADYTVTFRDLISETPPESEIYQSEAFSQWYERWRARRERHAAPDQTFQGLMRAANPVVIPRNHRVEEALSSAQSGDLQPFLDLLKAVGQPYSVTDSNSPYRNPPDKPDHHYRTFCGT